MSINSIFNGSAVFNLINVQRHKRTKTFRSENDAQSRYTIFHTVSRKKGLTSARRNILGKKVKDLECFNILKSSLIKTINKQTTF